MIASFILATNDLPKMNKHRRGLTPVHVFGLPPHDFPIKGHSVDFCLSLSIDSKQAMIFRLTALKEPGMSRKSIDRLNRNDKMRFITCFVASLILPGPSDAGLRVPAAVAPLILLLSRLFPRRRNFRIRQAKPTGSENQQTGIGIHASFLQTIQTGMAIKTRAFNFSGY
ncbi:hypothetical protein [Caenibacillus caldisaponilyticus]|uniref:hypothetical protein n=1 Tax=Caenibacillus caldisaponilyticus TaxID=1674942 RepID=UPI0011788916|nr:hypothetical protein [Caenibacillus caldisaponilyticus]